MVTLALLQHSRGDRESEQPWSLVFHIAGDQDKFASRDRLTAGGDDGALMNQLAGRLADAAGAGNALAEKALDLAALSRNEVAADKVPALIHDTKGSVIAVLQGRRSSMA